jgi:hypothetical protein
MMTKEIRIMRLENRIAIMSERGKDNARVIGKAKRRLRNMLAESPSTEA